MRLIKNTTFIATRMFELLQLIAANKSEKAIARRLKNIHRVTGWPLRGIHIRCVYFAKKCLQGDAQFIRVLSGYSLWEVIALLKFSNEVTLNLSTLAITDIKKCLDSEKNVGTVN